MGRAKPKVPAGLGVAAAGGVVDVAGFGVGAGGLAGATAGGGFSAGGVITGAVAATGGEEGRCFRVKRKKIAALMASAATMIITGVRLLPAGRGRSFFMAKVWRLGGAHSLPSLQAE